MAQLQFICPNTNSSLLTRDDFKFSILIVKPAEKLSVRWFRTKKQRVSQGNLWTGESEFSGYLKVSVQNKFKKISTSCQRCQNIHRSNNFRLFYYKMIEFFCPVKVHWAKICRYHSKIFHHNWNLNISWTYWIRFRDNQIRKPLLSRFEHLRTFWTGVRSENIEAKKFARFQSVQISIGCFSLIRLSLNRIHI